MNPQGEAAVVWNQPEIGIEATVRPPDSMAWQAPAELSFAVNAFGRGSYLPQIGLDQAGDAIASWGCGTCIDVAMLAHNRLLTEASLTRTTFRLGRTSGGRARSSSLRRRAASRLHFTLSTSIHRYPSALERKMTS
jgi:hypothetical protein